MKMLWQRRPPAAADAASHAAFELKNGVYTTPPALPTRKAERLNHEKHEKREKHKKGRAFAGAKRVTTFHVMHALRAVIFVFFAFLLFVLFVVKTLNRQTAKPRRHEACGVRNAGASPPEAGDF